MKTSTKLILGFFGILIFLLLVADISIWASYKKGNNNTDWVDKMGKRMRGPERPEEKLNEISVQPFKVLVVFNEDTEKFRTNPKQKEGNYQFQEYYMEINSSDKPLIECIGYSPKHKQSGDTLFLWLNNEHIVTLKTPGIQEIRSSYSRVAIGDINVDSLTITNTEYCGNIIRDAKIKNLVINGSEKNDLQIQEGAQIGSADITMKKGGELELFNVVFEKHKITVDSLDRLDLQGRSLNMLTSIK
ncbi:hypothetical protein ACE38W_09165 [Chitinophaga sp. Hz27]|uniref:hypothetical protein n=1 Tax=Chitinophaga sp. Hz27 TaxID=3347169 RepID=UPI0035DAAF63